MKIVIDADESGIEVKSDTMMDLRHLTIMLLKAAIACAEQGGRGPAGLAAGGRIVIPKITTGGLKGC